MADAAARLSAEARFLTGRGAYSDDLIAEGALHAVFVRSPHACARIERIDVSATRATAGVVAVLTAEDMAAAGLGTLKPLKTHRAPGGGEMHVPPRPALTGDAARYVGDPAALVVAESRAAAEDGAEAVEIDWAEGPAVTDLDAAVAPGAPAVWPEVPGNVAFAWEGGDRAAAEAAFAAAAHVTERRIVVTRDTGAPMEPRAATAEWDPATERWRLTTGLQAPWQTRMVLAKHFFGVAPERIEVRCPDVGGSFGMKGQTYPEYAALLQAARVLGRPVRWRATRSESLLTDDQGRDVAMTGALALDAEGRVLGLRIEGLTALGAYHSTRGMLTAVDNLPGACGPYRVPAAHAAMRGVHTHTPSVSPYRGAGRPEASLLIERLMDEAARETGRDPAALRRLNLLRPDELPHVNPLGFDYDCGDFAGALDSVLAVSDPEGFAARRAESAARGRLRGRGLAVVIARAANGQFEAARATLGPDGRLTLASGTTPQGQGQAGVFARLAAERLGLPAEAVDFVSGNTDLFDAAVGTFGSRSAAIGGSAALAACDALIEALRPEAGRALNAEAETLPFRDGAFRAEDGRALTLAALAPRLAEPAAADGRFAPEAATYPNGAHVCEVEIDRDTGLATVAGYWIAEDVGRVLDKQVVAGQVHGGIAQGLAQVLAERIAWDADGQPLTGSFMDFAVPRAADLPFFATVAHPVPTGRNPLGVKGAGEGGTVGALPAFQNAVADALAPFGVRDVPMPATAEALWRLMNGAGSGEETP